MCNPALVLLAGATALTAGGQVQAAKATAAANNEQARILDMNAKLSDRRARDAIQRGAQEEQRKRQEVSTIKGNQVAAMAANGVDLSFGSPLDTIVDTAVLGELDALTIRTNSYRESYDLQVDAYNKRSQAQISRAEAKSALTGGYLAAAGSVLTGASDGYLAYKKG